MNLSSHTDRLSTCAARLAGCALSLCLVAAATAQDRVRPPSFEGELSGRPILTTLLVVILAGMVFGAAAMPSKRGHQD